MSSKIIMIQGNISTRHVEQSAIGVLYSRCGPQVVQTAEKATADGGVASIFRHAPHHNENVAQTKYTDMYLVLP